MIHVTQTGSGEPMRFEVTVTDAGSTTRHEVMMSASDYERLAGGSAPDHLVEAAFRFLLEREPKESILRGFDLAVIGTYFPDFERELPKYL